MSFIFIWHYWSTYILWHSTSDYEMVSYTFPAVGSQTEEHRGDVPSRADDLSGATPSTLTVRLPNENHYHCIIGFM